MRAYELMTIYRPTLAEDEFRAQVEVLGKFLGDHGATVSNTDVWGKRRLAYEIDHVNEGYYAVTNFDAEAPVVAELERMLSLADAVLRHKVFRPE